MPTGNTSSEYSRRIGNKAYAQRNTLPPNFERDHCEGIGLDPCPHYKNNACLRTCNHAERKSRVRLDMMR